MFLWFLYNKLIVNYLHIMKINFKIVKVFEFIKKQGKEP